MIKILLCIFLLFVGCYTCPKDIFLVGPTQIESTGIDTVYFYDHPHYILYLHDQIYPYDYLRSRYYRDHHHHHHYLYDQPRHFIPDTQNYYERKKFEQRYNRLNKIDQPTRVKPTPKEIQKEKQIWKKRNRIPPKPPVPTPKEDKND